MANTTPDLTDPQQCYDAQLAFPQGLFTARFELPWKTYNGRDKIVTFTNALLDRMRAIPGVQSAGYTQPQSSPSPYGGSQYNPGGAPNYGNTYIR